MARRPKERYAPGELQRVRENLGPLSEEEAQRMVAILGGEIGVERPNEPWRRRMARLAELNRRKTDPAPVLEKKAPPKDADPTAAAESTGTEGADEEGDERASHSMQLSKTARPVYADRVRTDFLCARQEHGLKTRGQALASLLAFAFKIPDYVNPSFIADADHHFFRHVENLVLSVRGLISRHRKTVVFALRRMPGTYEVLKSLRDWDIEGIHTELSRLQRYPRSVQAGQCTKLCKLLYRPIMQLGSLDLNHHILRSVKTAFDLNLLAGPSKRKDQTRAKMFYQVARDELPRVFTAIRRRCYPLLMKSVGSPFYYYEEFFNIMEPALREFFDLEHEDILDPPPPEENALMSDPDFLAQLRKPTEKQEEATLEAGFSPASAVYLRGISMLERLFPRAGWSRLDEYPDLYPYFQPLFEFPRGVELISPRDPLQQVVVLIAILQDLLYGFRTIEFGSLRDERGDDQPLQGIMDSLVSSWNVYLDDVVLKQYIPQLYEYCRQIERNPDFAETEYGEKLFADLLWIRKQYVFPYQTMPQVKGIRSTPKPGVPILHEHVDDLRDILTRIALDIDSAAKESRSDGPRLGRSTGVSCRSMRNPFERYTFQVENPVSRRLDIVLKHRSPDSQGRMRMRDRRNNANLVFYTLSVVLVLDYLLNDPDSFYYKAEPELFRSIDGQGQEPVYTVDVLDPLKVMRQAEQNELSPPDELDALGGEVSRDALTGLRNSFGLKEELRRHIESYHENHKPFTVLALELHRFDAYVRANDQIEVERQLRNFATALTDTVREYADIPFRVQDHRFLMILRETTSEEAVPLLYRLNDRLSFEDSVLQRYHAAIVGFHRTWGAEKLLSTVDRSLSRARSYAAPAGILYDVVRNSHDVINLPIE